jgi:hypothetical protein
MDKDTAVLVNETNRIEITIGNEKILLKKLSLKQVLKLTKTLGKLFTTYSEQVKALKLDNKSNAQDVMELFNIIDESEVSEIISILIDKEPGFCRELSFKEITDIISAVIDLNYSDFAGILKNIQRISAKLTPAVQ